MIAAPGQLCQVAIRVARPAARPAPQGPSSGRHRSLVPQQHTHTRPPPPPAVLIVASFFPPVYFGFMCAPWTRLIYLTTTSLLGEPLGRPWAAQPCSTHNGAAAGPCPQGHAAHCPRPPGARTYHARRPLTPPPPFPPPPPPAAGLATLCVTLLSAFQKAEYQAYRALLFVSLGLWGIVPMLHGWALNGGSPEVTRALLLDVVMGAIYIVRAAPRVATPASSFALSHWPGQRGSGLRRACRGWDLFQPASFELLLAGAHAACTHAHPLSPPPQPLPFHPHASAGRRCHLCAALAGAAQARCL